jgi:outer membrane protein OmpA-like peptidoglycan-associated protein
MTRAIVIIICGTIICIELLALHACWQTVRPPSERPARIDDSIVGLNDGSVLVAKPGTLTRDVVDWFNDKNAAPARFDLGRVAFVHNSPVPAPEAEMRLRRFAGELKASRTVKAKIFVCTGGSAASDAELAALRAQQVSNALIASRIERSRISADTCRVKPARNGPSASEQDEQVVIIQLERGS